MMMMRRRRMMLMMLLLVMKMMRMMTLRTEIRTGRKTGGFAECTYDMSNMFDRNNLVKRVKTSQYAKK